MLTGHGRTLKLAEIEMAEYAAEVAGRYLALLEQRRPPDDPELIEARSAHRAFGEFRPCRWWSCGDA